MFQFIKKVMFPLIKKVMFSFIRKVMLPFCILLPIIRNDLPLFAFGILGPSIYLTIKAFSCLCKYIYIYRRIDIIGCKDFHSICSFTDVDAVLLPLFLRLDNHREEKALLTLVLLALRFATASPYGTRSNSFLDFNVQMNRMNKCYQFISLAH
jgi:hypothetical protein